MFDFSYISYNYSPIEEICSSELVSTTVKYIFSEQEQQFTRNKTSDVRQNLWVLSKCSDFLHFEVGYPIGVVK